MMNSEVAGRIKLAGEYQRKAIYALFPEKVSEHLTVIEKELKMIALEVLAEVLKERNESHTFNEQQSREQTSKVKKVDIG
ncbi:MAG: hypothetical protein IKL22_01740 [Lachnospiraceae bacterium]|nr:hypothetical protein [Lachnospiraceae bacterium]